MEAFRLQTVETVASFLIYYHHLPTMLRFTIGIFSHKQQAAVHTLRPTLYRDLEHLRVQPGHSVPARRVLNN